MRQKTLNNLNRIFAKSNRDFLLTKSLPVLLTVFGFFLYFLLAVYYANTKLPNLDEGVYLYEGYLFATDVYQPFQEYGFWMTKMPIAFLVWGWALDLLEPSLMVARYVSVLFSVLTLAGVWLVARRLTNLWLAALAVWVLALNPSWVSNYSIANSQVLIYFMLTWVLVFCLGTNRTIWQLAAGASLAGIMVLTRQNMVFILPILIIYLFWGNGFKKGVFSLLVAGIVIAIGHIIYWPEIFALWSRWLPSELFPFHERLSGSELIRSVNGPPIYFDARLFSLSMGIRTFFIPLVGSLFAIFYWPGKNAWRVSSNFRAAVFLAISFWVLVISHAWASAGKNYCVYCFSSYMAFFSTVGLIQVIIMISEIEKKPSVFIKLLTFMVIPLIVSIVWFSFFEQIGAGLLQIPIPRMRGGVFFPEWTTLNVILANRLDLNFSDARKLVPGLVGICSGFILLLLFRVIYQKFFRQTLLGFANFSVYCFLILGFVLLPILTWPQPNSLCDNNAITLYDEKIGLELSKFVRPGSKVYIEGARTAILLLYIKDVEILPPQLNDDNSFRLGGDPEQLLKKGYWNQEIALEWREMADVFIIGYNRISFFEDYFTDKEFEQLKLTLNLPQCPSDIQYYIYRRK